MSLDTKDTEELHNKLAYYGVKDEIIPDILALLEKERSKSAHDELRKFYMRFDLMPHATQYIQQRFTDLEKQLEEST